MTLTSSTDGPYVGDNGVLSDQCRPEAFWRTDVALEIWIDVERVPVIIRLAGTLDDATGGNLVSVVEELIADGCRDFELQAPALLVSDHGGIGMLMELQQAVRSSGGRLQLDPSVLVHDLPDDHDPPVRVPGRVSPGPTVPPR